jgi:hypothetical protein
VLMLTLVEPDQRVKVQVALRLSNMLAHAHPGATQLYCAVWCSKLRCCTMKFCAVQYMRLEHTPQFGILCFAPFR